MTFAPARLLEVRHYLQPLTGLPDSSLGIVGDENHLGGYHHGWDQRRTPSDYSWAESARDSSHRTNAARAFDIGMFAQLRQLSLWLVAQCALGAPDCNDIREIIYSPDGRTVRRWDRLGLRTSGDSSHLTHTHISYFADAEVRDKTSPFRRFFEGGGMATMERIEFLCEQMGWDIWDLFVDMNDVQSGGPHKGRKLKFTPFIKALATEVKAGFAADATRDAAVLTAIQALAAGNGNVDTAIIVNQIKAEANATRDLVEQQHAAEMAQLSRLHAAQLAEKDAEVAGLQAELARLTAQ